MINNYYGFKSRMAVKIIDLCRYAMFISPGFAKINYDMYLKYVAAEMSKYNQTVLLF